MNRKVQSVLSNNDIKLQKLTIDVVDRVNLTKKQVDLVKEGKIKLYPYVIFEYETTPTNMDIEIITGLDIKIGFTVEVEIEFAVETNENVSRSIFSFWVNELKLTFMPVTPLIPFVTLMLIIVFFTI
jgi:hypothetical protein